MTIGRSFNIAVWIGAGLLFVRPLWSLGAGILVFCLGFAAGCHIAERD